MATRFIARIGGRFATRMITRPCDNPSSPTHAGFMTGITASRINPGQRTMNHPTSTEGLGGQVAELTCSGCRKVIRRFGDDATSPRHPRPMTGRAPG